VRLVESDFDRQHNICPLDLFQLDPAGRPTRSGFDERILERYIVLSNPSQSFSDKARTSAMPSADLINS